MISFHELSLKPELMRAIEDLGFETPSPIQAEALPILLGEPTDFLGLAATGTGKTAAFAIPLLEKIDPTQRSVQALILCPTRELVLQTAGQIDLLGKHLGVRALPIYGGTGYADQINGIKRGATIVVGTPGRLVDHLNKGTLKLNELRVLVLDEADEMISMGFKEDLEVILSGAPRESSQIWLFSATMGREVRRVADDYLREPQQVQINRAEMVPAAIEQLYYLSHEGDKPEILRKLLDAADDLYGIVFCQTKALVVDLTQYLSEHGYRVDCLHGDMAQEARDRAMNAFRDRRTTLLVCTDVASRGLDVKDITHVFNYSIPRELDNYVHRIGRTARSGKTGFAMSLVTPSHRALIRRIEQMTKSRMKEGRIPTRKEIGAKKVSRLFAQFTAQASFARAQELLDDTWRESLKDMTAEEVAARFVTLSFPDLFVDRPERSSERPEARPRRDSAPAPTERYGSKRPRPAIIAGKAPIIVAAAAAGKTAGATPKVTPVAPPHAIAPKAVAAVEPKREPKAEPKKEPKAEPKAEPRAEVRAEAVTRPMIRLPDEAERAPAADKRPRHRARETVVAAPAKRARPEGQVPFDWRAQQRERGGKAARPSYGAAPAGQARPWSKPGKESFPKRGKVGFGSTR